MFHSIAWTLYTSTNKETNPALTSISDIHLFLHSYSLPKMYYCIDVHKKELLRNDYICFSLNTKDIVASIGRTVLKQISKISKTKNGRIKTIVSNRWVKKRRTTVYN